MSRITPRAGLFGPVLLAATALLAAPGCQEDDTGPLAGSTGGAAGKPAAPAGTAGANAATSGASSMAGGSAQAGRGSGGTTGGSAGSGATSGSGGSASGSGGSGNGGKAGQSGTGGSASGRGGSSGAGGGAGDSGGAPDSGGSSGTTRGCAGDLLICEDFEDTDVGDVPSGWTRHGDLAAVDDDQAHGGSRSLKLGPAANSERRIYHDASVLGSAHWGRIHYKVQTPTPDAFVHSTMVSLIGDGPQNGRSDYRPIDTIKQDVDTPDVGGRHNFIYNVQIIGSSEFGTETNYDYEFDAAWHCAEYHIQASNQSYALYLDGEEILSFERGAGNYDESDIPDSFDELRVGWINYQNAPPGFTAWIDDIAFDDERIGCE